jgi:hypothetical protein
MGPAYRHASRLKVITRDGREFEKLTLHRRGSPENPLSPEEIVSKFYSVVAPCMSRSDADRIVSLVDRLETLPDLRDLIQAIAAPVAVTEAASGGA